MPGLRIRCVQFQTLVVLAAYALAETQPDCACQFPQFGDDLCRFLEEQNRIVTSNEEQLKKYEINIHESKTFLKDAEAKITKVVNHLVERHINSVLKNAVADGTPTENPEGSARTNVTLDTNLALNRTHDYLTRVFKAMKDFSSELKETANRTKNPRVDEGDVGKRWSDDREQLLKRLDDLETSSSASKEELSSKIRQLEETNLLQRKELSDLRSEISPRLKEMEDKFTLWKNITEFQNTLRNHSEFGTGQQNDSANPPRPPSLEVLGVTSSSVTLKWRKDSGDISPATGYVIHYKKDYGSWKSEEVFGDLNTYTVTNLHCGMRYDFYITTMNGDGEQSDIVTGRTSGRAPIAPEKEDLLVVNATSFTIQLNAWKNGGCPITHFEIKHKPQRQKNWILFADRVSSNKKSITISGLTPSTWYQLQLTSHNEAGPTEAEYIFTTGAAVKAVQFGEKCADRAYPEYCKQIVEAKFCFREYYRGICCASCTKSGQLPPD